MKTKRNEKRNEFAMLMEGLLIDICKVLLGTAAIVGVVFAAGYIVDLLSGFVSLGAGMFVIFTFAGLMICFDGRSRSKESYRDRGNMSKRTQRRELCGR